MSYFFGRKIHHPWRPLSHMIAPPISQGSLIAPKSKDNNSTHFNLIQSSGIFCKLSSETTAWLASRSVGGKTQSGRVCLPQRLNRLKPWKNTTQLPRKSSPVASFPRPILFVFEKKIGGFYTPEV